MMPNSYPSVDIINLGCSKNLVDSEQLMTQLVLRGIKTRIDPERVDADILIINTCGFIHDAREESVNTILQAVETRRSGRIREIRVMGCLVQRYAGELAENIPEVDRWYGVNDLEKILNDFSLVVSGDALTRRIHSTPVHYAYLKVSEGCSHACTFCSIPAIRGKHVSRPVAEIISEARFLASNGTRELILIAQDLTAYGTDLYGEQRITPLVEKLHEIEEIDWIRLHYAYPRRFPRDLLDLMAGSDKVCRYLDLPLQHIADPVLKAMNRGIGRRESEELIHLIRERVPGVALRTTMLVGFPGEGEDEFDELMNFVADTRFDRLGVFTYSHEEGTRAGNRMADDVPEDVKRERADRLMELQQGISLELNLQRVGEELPVMIDRYEDGVYYGRTEADSPEVDQEVMVEGPLNTLPLGRICMVTITGAGEFDLSGVPSQDIL